MCFSENVKVVLLKHNCSPVMYDWGVFPNSKRCWMQKGNIGKTDVFHQI